MSGAREYIVPVGAARAYAHDAPDRTARVGAIPTTAEAIRFRVWPTRAAMLAAYYAHSPRCGAAAHECIKPIEGV
jgi:hypothetical protein